MNKNLLIVGAGAYGLIAKEIAESMHCFEKIAFADDVYETTPNGTAVIGKISDIENLVCDYYNIVIAVPDATLRLSLIQKLEEEVPCRIVTLVSPDAYVAPSAQIGKGCIVSPMVTIGMGSVLANGCIIGYGVTIGHCSMCCDGTHIECGATVAENTIVPAGTKVESGNVYKRNEISAEDLFFDPKQ